MKTTIKMRKAYLILCLMSLYPVAYAQTADSAQNLAGLPDRAPKTSIGQDNAQGTTAAAQSYEVKLDACPAGFTGGGVEKTRKVYTRPNGSVFTEAWYITKQDCKAVEDPRIADLQNSIRILSDRIVAVENKPIPTGGGATPTFSIRSGAILGTTENGTITGYCVSNAYSGWPNYKEQDIYWDNTMRPNASVGPWPNWPGRQVGPRIWTGPLCPTGMGFTQLTYTPQDRPEGE